MFLSEYCNIEMEKTISKKAKESCTYGAYYEYWREQLFERIMRLFVWENTECENDAVQPKEIEQRLLIAGHCGITRVGGELLAMFGSFYGVTHYYDEFTNYNVHCPDYARSRTIGKDVVVINNNAIRNSALPLVHHYATLLGHCETTLVNALINARDSGGVPIAGTEKQKQSITSYLTKLFNGQYGVVTDVGNMGIEYAGADRKTAQSIIDILQTRDRLLKSFYSDIGVRASFEKRGNTVTAEIESDTSLLLLNLSDMLDSRKRGAEKVNGMFGTAWDVHIAKEINYEAENEPKQPEPVQEKEGENDD